jgi:deoxyribodipyrimidine photo-lyase
VWLRRDLRIEDNMALDSALAAGLPVMILFIFDTSIVGELPCDDPRVSFIYERLSQIDQVLRKEGGGIKVLNGKPEALFKEIIAGWNISGVFINKDYEPYSIQRDSAVEKILAYKGINMSSFKDQSIFERTEIIKADGEPYTVFTPYSRKWIEVYEASKGSERKVRPATGKIIDPGSPFPALKELGFTKSSISVRNYDLSVMKDYLKFRDFPVADRTSYLSPHLRFGTVSIRKIVALAYETDKSFLNELIWREFFMQILANFPGVVTENFRRKYDGIAWRNDEVEFRRWCAGETGYPIVDAGMRQLNETGYMHNRVRMITAGFLCKHLLIDWRWGEAYFASRLLDYELSSNNGNWQWAAGTGCDAAPYFRIFSPEAQQKRFDRGNGYIRRWVQEIGKPSYPKPVVDHKFARARALDSYRKALINPIAGKHYNETSV